MKKCPSCKNRLIQVGKVELNFRHAIQGGNILKAMTWTGGYQFYVLAVTFILTVIVGSKNMEFALFGIFIPGFVIFLIMVRSKYNLYNCGKCKQQYAGPLLAKYKHGDSTYV